MKSSIAAAEVLLESFGWRTEHCRHVRSLALSLFDNLTKLHGLGSEERSILEVAALLHDIGWTISDKKHHKYSYQLIHDHKNKLIGFSSSHIELIAQVARYHRKAIPSLKQAAFAALSSERQLCVRKLAALLRLADGLDRPHLQAVHHIHCELNNSCVKFFIKATLDPVIHIHGAARKRELFEQVYKHNLEFHLILKNNQTQLIRHEISSALNL